MSRFKTLILLFGVIFCFSTKNNVRALEAESIVGGDYAGKHEFKYQISLDLCGQSICGGTIIADRYVLTAAHCVRAVLDTMTTFSLKIVAGTNDLIDKTEAVEVEVETIYIHAEYNPKIVLNDIAVLKLKESLNLDKNPHLEKVYLPMDDDTYTGEVATVSGYGMTSVNTITIPIVGVDVDIGGTTESLLKFAKVNIVDNKECGRDLHFKAQPSYICGKLVQRGVKPEGICYGDSGGPLVYDKTIIGIVSAGPAGCRQDKLPAVYTRVSSYLTFIRNILKGEPTNVEQHTIEQHTKCDTSLIKVIKYLIRGFLDFFKV